MKWYDILFIIVSLIVIVLSLLQGGKSEGASGAITGGGLNVFAKTKERGSEKVVSWLTFGFAILFLFFALLIMIGTSDLKIVGTTEQGKEVVLFRNGTWAF